MLTYWTLTNTNILNINKYYANILNINKYYANIEY